MSRRRRVLPGLIHLGERVVGRIFKTPVPEEVDEELAFHVEMRVRELLERGHTLDEARAEAVARFGDMEAVKAVCRRLGREREGRMTMRTWWEDLRHDVGFALRQLGRNPGFTAVVVLTLGLAMGAGSAVFSAVNGVLLRPLPYERPDELVSVWSRYLPSSGLDIPTFPLSPPEWIDLREQSESLREVVPYIPTTRTVATEEGAPTRVGATYVGAGMFDLLGVRAALGRVFAPEEEVAGAPPAAVLSHELWRGRFGGDPEVVGRTLLVEGRTVRVVGVMPEGFVFPSASTELWMPLGLDEADLPGRGSHYLLAVGRRAPGVGLERARSELETITAAWYEEFDHHAMGHFLYLEELKDDMVGDTAEMLWLLLAAVGLVLLVACANVANLLLARTERREREVAVRVALGAGRGRLVRQLVTESVVLAGLGGLVGVLVAWGVVEGLLALDPTVLPRSGGVAVDGTVMAFTAAVALGTALLFGVVPPLHAGLAGPGRLRSDHRSTAGRGRMRLRRGLVAAEAALAVVVVVAAGLVTRSLWSLTSVDPGVRAEEVLTFRITLPAASYADAGEIREFYDRLLERVEALPGVARASAATAIPLGETPQRNDFLVEGRPRPEAGEAAPNADVVVVRPGYMETMGIPVVRGRDFRGSDGPDGPFVALLNQAAAERYWPGDDVLGARVGYDFSGETGRPWLTVAGVVGNTAVESLEEGARPQVYLLHSQAEAAWGGTPRTMSVVARADASLPLLADAVRRAVGELDPGLAVDRLRTMEQVVSASVARPRLTAVLLSGFGLLALLLAAVGMYAVVAWSVASRTREIGVRMALGARGGSVVALMVREVAVPGLVGIVVGLLAALAGAGLIRGLLFQVEPTDPLTFVAVSAGLAVLVLVACWIPAARATRVPPTAALREE